jgi:hypothetical protein
VRTTFNIEDGLLEEVKNLARQRKNTLGTVLNEALRLGLLRSSESPNAKSSAPLKTFRGDGLQAGVDLHNSSELLDRMERS